MSASDLRLKLSFDNGKTWITFKEDVVATEPPVGSTPSLDPFGIKKLYPTNGKEWYSTAWSANPRKLTSGQIDNYDSRMRITGNGYLEIPNDPALNKQNIAILGGSVPRLHLGFEHENVEITMYGLYLQGKLAGWSGHQCEFRTNDYHTGTNNCKAVAYESILTYDQRIDFGKELSHPNYTSKRDTSFAWDTKKWFGLKIVCQTLKSTGKVSIQAFVDDSNGLNGGNWVKKASTVDSGGWKVAYDTATNCGYPTDRIITGIMPTIIFRDDTSNESDSTFKKYLKYHSVREIDGLP